MELIVLGELHKINATLGEVLQLRPKGRNNRSITSAINAKGDCSISPSWFLFA